MGPGGEAEAQPCAGSAGPGLRRQCGVRLAEPCAGSCARHVLVRRECGGVPSGMRVPSGVWLVLSARFCRPSRPSRPTPGAGPRSRRRRDGPEKPSQPRWVGLVRKDARTHTRSRICGRWASARRKKMDGGRRGFRRGLEARADAELAGGLLLRLRGIRKRRPEPCAGIYGSRLEDSDVQLRPVRLEYETGGLRPLWIHEDHSWSPCAGVTRLFLVTIRPACGCACSRGGRAGTIHGTYGRAP